MADQAVSVWRFYPRKRRYRFVSEVQDLLFEQERASDRDEALIRRLRRAIEGWERREAEPNRKAKRRVRRAWDTGTLPVGVTKREPGWRLHPLTAARLGRTCSAGLNWHSPRAEIPNFPDEWCRGPGPDRVRHAHYFRFQGPSCSRVEWLTARYSPVDRCSRCGRWRHTNHLDLFFPPDVRRNARDREIHDLLKQFSGPICPPCAAPFAGFGELSELRATIAKVTKELRHA